MKKNVKKYFRFITGLQRYMNSRISPEQALADARTMLAERKKERHANFLALLEKGVFGYPKSPYLPLLEHKKISLHDIRSWIERDGLDSALQHLQHDGVYFTVDEFKGKSEVVRDGLRFRCAERQFDNPFLSEAYEVSSGATRSAGTRIRIDFDYLLERSYYDAFLLNLHGALNTPIANWFPLFPGAPGINSNLRFSHFGNAPQRWFSQVDKAHVRVNWERKLGTRLIFLFSHLNGARLAEPEFVDLNHAYRVAQWAHETLQEHPVCTIYTFAASAVRVCMAAQESGWRLDGVRFLVTGETLTPQKRKEIESVGATPVPVYGISEAGVIAAGCPVSYSAGDHCHLYEDSTAVISHPYKVPHFDTQVDSFLFTTLLFTSPKLLINVGMGDYGHVSHGPCSCEFGDMGFHTHLTDIRSYEKLTGEGVTFVDTDFIRIMEHDLPRDFGGQSTDYQLVEEEDEKGLSHLCMLVSPRLGELDTNALVNRFIDRLHGAEDKLWAQAGTAMWAQARTVRVKRDYPMPTASGKILPFHLKRK